MKVMTTVVAMVGMSIVVGCSASEDDADPAASTTGAIETEPDDLIACKKVANGRSGSIHIFRVDGKSKDESEKWGEKVVAIGFKGKLDGDTVGYSQGDQPDLEASYKRGDAYDMDFLMKDCPGTCANTMTLSDGNVGEDEGFGFITVQTLRIDMNTKTARLVGVREGVAGGGSSPITLDYENCDLNEHVIENVHDKLKD